MLTAHHCTTGSDRYGKSDTPCDHSDEQRVAVLGTHMFNTRDLWAGRYRTIPIIKVLAPPDGKWKSWDEDSHDFALLVLKHPAKITNNVAPICLPEPNAEFGGQKAIAAGWGRTNGPSISIHQSPVLKKVNLTVSKKIYSHDKIFGTKVSKLDNLYQDPCSGDSGNIDFSRQCLDYSHF